MARLGRYLPGARPTAPSPPTSPRSEEILGIRGAILRSIALVGRGPKVSELPRGVPPQLLAMMPILFGGLKMAATHMPEDQLIAIIRNSRDMMDAWLEAAEVAPDGRPSSADAAPAAAADGPDA